MQSATLVQIAKRGFQLAGAQRSEHPGSADVEPQATGEPGGRRGSALILTLVLTLGLASLATSAIYLGSNARLISDTYNREGDLRYAAEATLAMGKSTLNYDPLALPDTGAYRTVFQNNAVNGADGLPIPGVTTSMYLGRTSSNTGQFGAFVSVVAVAKNSLGATVVRRLELAQESFAKFSYWSNQESNNGQTIYFNNNDQIWGPVWSNDAINIGSNGARFHDDVGTAMTVMNAAYGTFDKGYSQNQKRIELPPPASLSFLAGYASAGQFNFSTPTSAGIDQVMTRIQFVAKDVNGDGKLDGTSEGFFRVYTASTTAGVHWLRGDFSRDNCGAAYTFQRGTAPMFVPLSEHNKEWFARALNAAGLRTDSVKVITNGNDGTGGNNGNGHGNGNGNNQGNGSGAGPAIFADSVWQQVILQQQSARCYLGGDPNLRAVNLRGTSEYTLDTLMAYGNGHGHNPGPTDAAFALAGTDTTFTATGPMGSWTQWPGSVDPGVQGKWPAEAPYLFPIYRGFNPGTKGVIYVTGTVGVSGQLRGRITLYATGSVALLDDILYVTDPSLNKCKDILGLISGNDIMLADNALNDPPDISNGSYVFKNMDVTKDTFVDGVIMALHTAFGAENYAGGAWNTNGCEGSQSGRGCLYLTGGVIQQQRGPVGVNYGNTYYTGYTKRYSYDRCALYSPPPYFPTTGRYTDNRYYELDPNGFDVKKLFTALTPN